MRSISIQAFDKIKYSIYNGPGMMKIVRADFICIKCTKFWKNTFLIYSFFQKIEKLLKIPLKQVNIIMLDFLKPIKKKQYSF